MTRVAENGLEGGVGMATEGVAGILSRGRPRLAGVARMTGRLGERVVRRTKGVSPLEPDEGGDGRASLHRTRFCFLEGVRIDMPESAIPGSEALARRLWFDLLGIGAVSAGLRERRDERLSGVVAMIAAVSSRMSIFRLVIGKARCGMLFLAIGMELDKKSTLF